MRNDPCAPQSLGRRPTVNDITHQCQPTLHPTIYLTDIIHQSLVPQQIPGPNGSGRSLPPGRVRLQPQQPYDQRMDVWTATPPSMLQASLSFSALYRFTPDINDMDEECRRPPNQGPVRTDGNIMSGSAQTQPRGPIDWKMYDEPSSNLSDQPPSPTGDRDPR